MNLFPYYCKRMPYWDDFYPVYEKIPLPSQVPVLKESLTIFDNVISLSSITLKNISISNDFSCSVNMASYLHHSDESASQFRLPAEALESNIGFMYNLNIHDFKAMYGVMYIPKPTDYIIESYFSYLSEKLPIAVTVNPIVYTNICNLIPTYKLPQFEVTTESYTAHQSLREKVFEKYNLDRNIPLARMTNEFINQNDFSLPSMYISRIEPNIPLDLFSLSQSIFTLKFDVNLPQFVENHHDNSQSYVSSTSILSRVSDSFVCHVFDLNCKQMSHFGREDSLSPRQSKYHVTSVISNFDMKSSVVAATFANKQIDVCDNILDSCDSLHEYIRINHRKDSFDDHKCNSSLSYLHHKCDLINSYVYDMQPCEVFYDLSRDIEIPVDEITQTTNNNLETFLRYCLKRVNVDGKVVISKKTLPASKNPTSKTASKRPIKSVSQIDVCSNVSSNTAESVSNDSFRLQVQRLGNDQFRNSDILSTGQVTNSSRDTHIQLPSDIRASVLNSSLGLVSKHDNILAASAMNDNKSIVSQNVPNSKYNGQSPIIISSSTTESVSKALEPSQHRINATNVSISNAIRPNNDKSELSSILSSRTVENTPKDSGASQQHRVNAIAVPVLDDIVDSYFHITDLKPLSMQAISATATSINAPKPSQHLSQSHVPLQQPPLSQPPLPQPPLYRTSEKQLSGLTVCFSEEWLENNTSIITQLSERYGIQMIDCYIEPPVSIIIDVNTGVSFIPARVMFNMQSDDELRNYLRTLINASFKYSMIWLVLLHDTASRHPLSDGFRHTQYMKLFQAFAKFPNMICFRECYIDMDSGANIFENKRIRRPRHVNVIDDSLLTMIYDICLATAKRANAIDISPMNVNSSFTPFTSVKCMQRIQDNSRFRVHCEFLQLFPSINIYLASFILSCVTLKELSTMSINDLCHHLHSSNAWLTKRVDNEKLQCLLFLLQSSVGLHVN